MDERWPLATIIRRVPCSIKIVVVTELSVSLKTERRKKFVCSTKIAEFPDFNQDILYAAKMKVHTSQRFDLGAFHIQHHKIDVLDVVFRNEVLHGSRWSKKHL